MHNDLKTDNKPPNGYADGQNRGSSGECRINQLCRRMRGQQRKRPKNGGQISKSSLNQLQKTEAELRTLLRQPRTAATPDDAVLAQFQEMSDAWNVQQLDETLEFFADGAPATEMSAEKARAVAERATAATANVENRLD